jgi:hypothetical protein
LGGFCVYYFILPVPSLRPRLRPPEYNYYYLLLLLCGDTYLAADWWWEVGMQCMGGGVGEWEW